MDFLKLLRSFEEFLFEATSWLLFYPLTFWRLVRQPLAMMDYSDREQSDQEERRYDDTVSPPLVLLATLVMLNILAVAAHVEQPGDGGSHALAWLIASPERLILFRSLVFGLIPAIAAAMLLKRQGKKISRDTLRPPFYAQCYLAAACAAFVSIGHIVFQRPELPNTIGAVLMMGGLAWFLINQSRWFRHKLSVGWIDATMLAARGVIYALAYLALLIVPLALV